MVEMSYVLIHNTATTGELGIIKWGESGYYPTNYPDNYTQEMVDTLNERIGVSKAEAHSMEMCSRANPDNWEEHFNKCMNIYNKHMASL